MWQDDLFTSKLNMFVFKNISSGLFTSSERKINQKLNRLRIITKVRRSDIIHCVFILIKKLANGKMFYGKIGIVLSQSRFEVQLNLKKGAISPLKL